MNRSIALMGSLLAVCGAMLVPQSVHADFVGHPVTGAAIVTNGRFTNIYVYHPNFDTETWDQHLAAISDAWSNLPDEIRAAILRVGGIER